MVKKVKEKEKKLKRPDLTRAQAIKKQCIECMGFQKIEVKTCPDRACALWPYRKGRGKEETDVLLREQK